MANLRVSLLAASLIAAGSLLAPVAAAQVSPVGLWTVTAYNDATPGLNVMGTQNICFLAGGTWFGTTFPGWGGRWFQKGLNAAGHGDRVRIVGNYANGVGNDSAELDFVHGRLMTGPWTEWRDAFPFLLYARLSATRIGACGPLTLDATIPAPAPDDGISPWERDGASPPTCPAAVEK